MPDACNSLPTENADMVRRVTRFLAIFGIVYGLLGFIQFLSECRYWQFWFRVVADGFVIQRGYMVGGFILCASYIWLLIASMAFLWGKPRARASLFAWAIFALGIEVLREATLVDRPMSELIADLRWVMESLVRWPMELGFPAMLLCALSLNSSAGMSSRGFAVLHQASEAFNKTQPSPVARVRQYAYRILRRIARFALWLGLLGLIDLFIQAKLWRFPNNNRVPPDSPRYPIMTIVLLTKQLSFAILMIGAIAVLLGRRIGRTLLLIWTVLFLAMSVMQYVLYDAMYLLWAANNSNRVSDPWPLIAALNLLSAMKTNSFAIISAYLLVQPEMKCIRIARSTHPRQ